MPSNQVVGQNALDLFLQKYRGNSEFFTEDDATRFCGMAFGKIMKDSYTTLKVEIRAEKEEGFVEFSHDFMSEVFVDVQKDAKGPFALLPQKIMSFPFDSWYAGIGNVYPNEDSGCGEFIRHSVNTVWELCDLPQASVTFWWGESGRRIRFKSASDCIPKKVQVFYIPASDNDEYDIPDTLEMDVLTLTLNLMIAAKNQRPVVKQTNDGNFNAVMETESNVKQP